MPRTLERRKADLLAEAAQQAVTGPAYPGSAPAGLDSLVAAYYRDVAPQDLLGRSPVDVYGAARAHLALAATRTPGTPRIRIGTPQYEEAGWQSRHTVVEIVTDDMPYVVDSVTMEINRHGYGIHLVVHPILRVRRDEAGRLVALLPAGSPDGTAESYVHVEIDQQTDPAALADLRDDLLRVLADVRVAVEDGPAMTARARELVAGLAAEPVPCPAEEVDEARALLGWMADDNFTFLGYREYDLLAEPDGDVLRPVPGTGLGILRERAGETRSRSFGKLSAQVRELARAPHLLNLTKANSHATVHRPVYLDYVGVKRFDADGRVVGERRFLGLYASLAYTGSATEIPVLRRKVAAVLDRAGFPPDSHSGKDLRRVLETYPRDELFPIGTDELYDIATGILALAERRQVRLFTRRDEFGRFVTCLVYLPRDRYTTEVRIRVQDVLLAAYGGESIEYSTWLSESVLARLHFLVRTPPGSVPSVDTAEVERRLAAAVRTWSDELRDALVDEHGEERGLRLAARYGEAFSPAYRADIRARAAVADVARLEEIDVADGMEVRLYRPPAAPPEVLRFKLYRSGSAVSLSDVLPLLRDMGVEVVDERPYSVDRGTGVPAWVYDFGLRLPDGASTDLDAVRAAFEEAFTLAWRGEVESDGFNRLVLGTGLDWREVRMLRAYCHYLRQLGSRYSQAYMEDVLADNPAVTRLVVRLFHARFDPAEQTERAATLARLDERLAAALDEVTSLDADRILRSYVALVQATLRTNFFSCDEGGRAKPYLSVKLAPEQVPDVPQPRPAYEVFVHSPRMEGVHLRAGAVARGGIRASDRREDYRTEILGLMKAQNVKNSVIVPVGAKGGFVVKRPPAGDRDALAVETLACYRTLMRGMLDLTDTIRDGAVVTPPDLVRHDGDDPYLVVAADKGTATFSDEANAVAASYGYWLGDAFASGGSTGYDHKRMGITARGAWESVRHHFDDLGIDVDTTPVTAVGIGDMSGDVFGNGMLLCPNLRLVAAFDHRHVFVDPDPDPAASYAERRRLFDLPRSSWDDYDRALISPGGGVHPRTAKSVPISEQARRALGIDAERLTPAELIRAVLRAPVDLLWNGGIGTYVKAAHESHADVADRTNDAVRVDARELRCLVVGEGGNLGFTQLGRVEYALAGGRVFTDAIDNSAGVDCSDHEVNLKILLDTVVASGELTVVQRNRLLAEMTDEVAGHVLAHNRSQTGSLGCSRAQAADMLTVHARYLDSLESAGHLDRALESLPDAEEIARRAGQGEGLTGPELAVLLAVTKNTLYAELLGTDLADEPYLHEALRGYFPATVRDRFAAAIDAHRLHREIITTVVVNEMVDAQGSTFVFRLREGTGAASADLVRAYTAARDCFDIRALRTRVESASMPAAGRVALLLEVRTLVERASRWLLRNRPAPLDLAATVAAFREGIGALAGGLADLLADADRERVQARTAQLVEAGADEGLAGEVAMLGPLLFALDVVDVAGRTGAEVTSVAQVYYALDDRLDLAWLLGQVTALPRRDRWETMARAALRDDLWATHSALTTEVVRTGDGSLPPAERIERWFAAAGPEVERSLAMLAEVRAAGGHDLASLSVALRELRALTGAAPGRDPDPAGT